MNRAMTLIETLIVVAILAAVLALGSVRQDHRPSHPKAHPMKTVCTITFEAKTLDGELVTSASSTEVLADPAKAVAFKNLVTAKLLEIGADLNTKAAQMSTSSAGGK